MSARSSRLRTSLDALAALLAIAMVCLRAEATDCTKTPDLLENCDQWTACVKSAGVGCFNPYSHPGNLLFLWKLKISGTIPIDVGQMTELNILYLSNNQISGTIPDAIDQLTELTEWGLKNNTISGTIPDAFGQLTKLQFLELYTNEISGTIPDAIGQLTELLSLALSYNQISGTVPDVIGQLTKIKYVDLSYNQITGASAGICAFNDHIYPDDCVLFPNPDWTNGAMCPTCLNTVYCKPPVTCTNTSF
tara:strand:- start:686 stop:1432 length:747 start_codon:yes stop_codon:yes gene_type:complete